ncbi:unnamed protein product, partial [Amoebophrya sp. A25]|eukprot:GSA25T00003541001.1
MISSSASAPIMSPSPPSLQESLPSAPIVSPSPPSLQRMSTSSLEEGARTGIHPVLGESEALEVAATLRCPILQLQRSTRLQVKAADKNIGHIQGYLEQE